MIADGKRRPKLPSSVINHQLSIIPSRQPMATPITLFVASRATLTSFMFAS
jgi:hypothetical protein